jgi:hypothetical protein
MTVPFGDESRCGDHELFEAAQISPSLANNDKVCDDVCGGSGFHPTRFPLLNPRYFGSGFAGLGA